MTAPRMFPIMAVGQRYAMQIPWELIAPHEPQARTNHCGQSLEELARRGGLSAAEAWCVMHGLPFFDKPAVAFAGGNRRRVSDEDAFVYLANLSSALARRDAEIAALTERVKTLTAALCREQAACDGYRKDPHIYDSVLLRYEPCDELHGKCCRCNEHDERRRTT